MCVGGLHGCLRGSADAACSVLRWFDMLAFVGVACLRLANGFKLRLGVIPPNDGLRHLVVRVAFGCVVLILRLWVCFPGPSITCWISLMCRGVPMFWTH